MLLKVLDKIAPDMIGTNVRSICLPFYIGIVVENNNCIAVTLGRSRIVMIDKLQIGTPKYDPAWENEEA